MQAAGKFRLPVFLFMAVSVAHFLLVTKLAE
jgi:hypothetical protein